MIVQCQACQTRFRLADEKVKPGGTKVRCSKCKEIFTVTPPEPEPAEESVDFGSFNMEAVTDEPSAESTTEPEAGVDEESVSAPSPEPEESDEGQSDDVDFSGLEAEMGSETGPGEELADDFSFADTSEPVDDQGTEEDSLAPAEQETPEGEGTTDEEQTDFGAAFEETDEPAAMEFDFNEEQEPASAEPESFEIESTNQDAEETTEFSFDDSEEDTAGAGEFSFDDAAGETEEEPGDFSFDDDDNAFSIDDEDTTATETSESGEFSFDEETPFGDDSSAEWGDDSSEGGDSFDFEEPQFDSETDSAPETDDSTGGDEGGLQFGEIDFAGDGGEEASTETIEDDFSGATMETQSEPESFTPQEQPAPPARDYDDVEPLPAPPKPKKSSLSRILVLLVLLLVILGGAAAFLFMQGGTANLNMVTEYLPFLKDYIGESQQLSPTDSIDINVSGSSYVTNAEVGQMLVIQGAAVNKRPSSRSSITIKGVLLDAQGRTLLQQTVFCGNQISDSDLESLTFKQIEEAMNNEFGAGLSNMNVSAGASIPFTIVFRNLPDGIANINVEVVDSKPGTS